MRFEHKSNDKWKLLAEDCLMVKLNEICRKDFLLSEDEVRGGEETNQYSNMFK